MPAGTRENIEIVNFDNANLNILQTIDLTLMYCQ